MINLFPIVYIMQDDDIKVIIRIDFLFIIYSFVIRSYEKSVIYWS